MATTPDPTLVEAAFEEASLRATEPTRFPGLTYEEGLADALSWATGNTTQNPLEED